MVLMTSSTSSLYVRFPTARAVSASSWASTTHPCTEKGGVRERVCAHA